MNIVLFHPRGYDRGSAVKNVSHLAATLPPLGLLSIAAALRAAGHTVTLLDASRNPEVANSQWAKRIIDRSPDIVAFSAITAAFLDAYDVCLRVKRLRETALTVFGGVHASWGKQSLLKRFEAIDCIIAGEGEEAMVALAGGHDRKKIEGLCCRDGAGIRYNGDRRVLCKMDDLPFPAYDLLDGFPGGYHPPLFSYPRRPATSVVSSRGCIYQCSYCDRSVFGRTFRWYSPEYTVELVSRLRKDFGIRHVMFYDDLFTLNRARVARLCALWRERLRGMSFNCIVRISHIDRELIAELKSAGCWMVNVGIESGDQDLLDSFKEGLRLDDIRRDIGLLHDAGIWVKGLFMIGFPGETEESMVQTIEFAKSLPLKDANVTAFTPFPGAPVAAGIEKLGALDNDWSKMDCTKFVFVSKEIGSRLTLEKYYSRFIREFYRRPYMRKVYRSMLFQSPHSWWRLIKSLPAFLKYAAELRPEYKQRPAHKSETSKRSKVSNH